jgi:hypothetical protein
VSEAQQEALERAAAASGPIKIHGGTARILAGRYGYLSPEGDGWVITPRGLVYLAGDRAKQHRRDVEQKLSGDNRKWAKRVLAWMEAHKRLHDWSFGHKRHAEHVAACDHAGVEPVALGQWADGAREFVEQAVRAAADCLVDFDTALAKARERGVGVSVSYEADEKVPRSRREAATAASQGSVVSLSTYRERRPATAEEVFG